MSQDPRLPVPVAAPSPEEPAQTPIPDPPQRRFGDGQHRRAFAAFAAQLIGGGAQRRGLKGGAPVLETARGAYLGTEYSGAADRRPRPGRIARTEV